MTTNSISHAPQLVALNFHGHVGTTTLARHLLKPAFSGAVVDFRFESCTVEGREQELQAFAKANEVSKWVVPALPGPRCAAYAEETIKVLLSAGVAASSISVVKNKVSDVGEMDHDYAILFQSCLLRGVRLVDAPVLDFDLYSELDNVGQSLEEIVADTTDYRYQHRASSEAGNRTGALEAVEKKFRRKVAKGVLSNLVQVRSELLGESTPDDIG